MAQGTAALAAGGGKGPSHPAFFLSEFWACWTFQGLLNIEDSRKPKENRFPIWRTTRPRSPQDGAGQGGWEEEDLSWQLVCKTTAPHLRLSEPQRCCHHGTGTEQGQTGLAAPPDPSFPTRIKGKQAVINLSGAQDPSHSGVVHAHTAVVRTRSTHQPLLASGSEL